MMNTNNRHTETNKLINEYLLGGGRVTRCPDAAVVSKWDRRMKGPQVVRGGRSLYLGW